LRVRKRPKMSDGKIYLNREEQEFLIEMLEIDDPIDAVEKFAFILVDERADPNKLQDYVKKIMKNRKKIK
jgi:hypothetical protein